jgi:HPt (histidine-containing phosphotransfer) domain-containing protein
LAVGINDFQSKPINPEELFLTLARWLPPMANAQTPSDSRVQPEQRPAHNNESHLELAQLLDAVAHDQDRAKALIEKFLILAADIHCELDQAIKIDDCVSMGRLAHKLKSSASLLGANDLAAHCEELEAASHAADHSVSKVCCLEVIRSLDIVCVYLRRRFAIPD